MSGARSRRRISSPAMSPAASPAAMRAREFAGTPDRPARIAGNVARNGTFLGVTIVDPRGDIVATSLPRRCRGSTSPTIPPSAPMSRATPAGCSSARRSAARLARPERDLAEPPAEPSGRLVRRGDRGQHPARSVHRLLPRRPGRSDDMMSVIGLDGIARARRARAGVELRRGHARHAPVMRRQMQRSERHLSRPERARRQGTLFQPSAARAITACSSPTACCNRRCSRRRAIAPASSSPALLWSACSSSPSPLLLTFYLVRRERREAEMARANERLQEAQRIGQIGDWDYDLRTGAVYWSPQLCAQFERDPAQGSPTFEEFKAYLDERGPGDRSTAPMPRRSAPARARKSNMRSACRAARNPAIRAWSSRPSTPPARSCGCTAPIRISAPASCSTSSRPTSPICRASRR